MIFFKKNKIFLIDDNDGIRKTTPAILSQWGFEVETAASGEAALRSVKKAKPNLILLDVGLPGISGYDLCRLFKENSSTRKVPIILLTGLSTIGDVDKGFNVGADAYLTKPIDWDRMRAKISELLKIKI